MIIFHFNFLMKTLLDIFMNFTLKDCFSVIQEEEGSARQLSPHVTGINGESTGKGFNIEMHYKDFYNRNSLEKVLVWEIEATLE